MTDAGPLAILWISSACERNPVFEKIAFKWVRTATVLQLYGERRPAGPTDAGPLAILWTNSACERRPVFSNTVLR
jgi:hypothetical protein